MTTTTIDRARAVKRDERLRRSWRRRLAIAAKLVRFARWIARGAEGGAEKDRQGGGGPIYELPSGELFVHEDVDPMRAKVRVFGAEGGLAFVSLTREQAGQLAFRLATWSRSVVRGAYNA